ncbi:MAG: lipopolysaccharide heptosyltransferase II [Calditrichia bacterium]
MKVDLSSLKKILVIQLRAIGDVVLTTGALAILRKHLPEAQIHFLTSRGIDRLLNTLPEIDQVKTYSYSVRNPFGVIRILPEIRRERYDLIIDYQGTPGTAYLTRLSGAPFRLGWKMKRRQWAYNLHSSANNKLRYVVHQKCEALEEIGISDATEKTKLVISQASKQKVDELFQTLKIDTSRLLVNITPKGKRPARTWFPERVAKLTDLLIEKHRATVFYNWAPGEREYAEYVRKLGKNQAIILPRLPMEVFAAFLSKIDLHVSYDNGPKHMAIALGTSTLSLFATDPPEFWNPVGNPEAPYILADVPCKFCRLRECGLMICMKKIEPEEVLQKIEQIPSVRKKLQLPAEV